MAALQKLAVWLDAGQNPDGFPGKLQELEEAAESALATTTSQTQLHLEEVEDSEPPEEMVAAAVLHLDGLLSFLTKAARLGWELPTSQVQLPVGARPRGSSLERYGFTFRAAGKHGQETSWRVER